MSYTQLLYHIVFRTKSSKNTIPEQHDKELYAYIMGIINNKRSKLYRIGGMPNHIHLLVDIHPTIAVSDFMKRACLLNTNKDELERSGIEAKRKSMK